MVLNRTVKTILLVVMLLYSVSAVLAQETDLKLWYDKPSGKIWERALPVGKPVISEKAQLKPTGIKATQLYDFETKAGKTYTLAALKKLNDLSDRFSSFRHR